MKKGQGSLVGVIIVLVVLIIVAFILFFVIFNVNNGFGNLFQNNPTTTIVTRTIYEPTTNSQTTQTTGIVCNYPYLRYGTGCCMDANQNGVCDNSEYQQTYVNGPYDDWLNYGNGNYDYQNDITCHYPYIQIGSTCCIDDNRNGVCDTDEYYHSSYSNSNGYLYEVHYSRVYDYSRPGHRYYNDSRY